MTLFRNTHRESRAVSQMAHGEHRNNWGKRGESGAAHTRIGREGQKDAIVGIGNNRHQELIIKSSIHTHTHTNTHTHTYIYMGWWVGVCDSKRQSDREPKRKHTRDALLSLSFVALVGELVQRPPHIQVTRVVGGVMSRRRGSFLWPVRQVGQLLRWCRYLVPTTQLRLLLELAP